MLDKCDDCNRIRDNCKPVIKVVHPLTSNDTEIQKIWRGQMVCPECNKPDDYGDVYFELGKERRKNDRRQSDRGRREELEEED